MISAWSIEFPNGTSKNIYFDTNRDECAGRPRSFGDVDTAEVFGGKRNGIFKREGERSEYCKGREKLGKKYWGRHLWSRGYCVSTIGIDEERIREYVKWQEKKEQEMEQLQGELFDEAED